MKNFTGLISKAFVLMITAGIAFSCTVLDSDTEGNINWEENGFMVQFFTDKSVVVAGTEFKGIYRLTNISNSTFGLHTSCPMLGNVVVQKNSQYVEFWGSGINCVGVVGFFEIKPGETLERVATITTMQSVRVDEQNYEDVPADPGIYKVSFSDFVWSIDDEKAQLPKADPVYIEIKAADR